MWEINKHIVFVKGAKNAAIYNFNNGHVYSINNVGAKLIDQFISKETDALLDIENNYLHSLLELGILSNNFFPQKYFPQTPSMQLNFAWIELTAACNLRCVHCYEGDCHNKLVNEFSLTQWLSILNQLSDNGCKSIQFTGGEAALFPFLYSMIDYASTLSFSTITLFTNATLLDDKLIDLLANRAINVRFSLYGSTPQTHDEITQVQGSFEKTIGNIKKLISKGVKVTPAVVLMRQNENDLNSIKILLSSLGLSFSSYDVIRHVFGGTQSKFSPTNKEIILGVHRKEPFFTITKEKFDRAYAGNTCWNGKLAITSSGTVLPCVFARNIEIGDLNKQTVSEILSSDALKTIWGFDYSCVSICKDCEFRFACKDCRPLGMSIDGNISEKNPRCCYDPYAGIWQPPKP